MFLTIELLKEYKACPEGIGWFARHFPDGAELIDVMNTHHIPLSFLDWGFLHLTTNSAEKERYYTLVNIDKNSHNIFSSHNIENSNMVTDSTDIKNSSYIYFSTDVTESTNITHSTRVQSSQTISTSNAIYTSQKIVQSNNIKNSNNVSFSSYIIDSADIYKSTLITNSSFQTFCSNVQNSVFCSHLNNSDHCLFCYKTSDLHYCIFNKQINKATWEFIFNEFTDIFTDINLTLFDLWEQENPNAVIKINHNYQTMYNSIFSKTKYVNWVKNLPYYDSLLAYEITLQPTFLQ